MSWTLENSIKGRFFLLSSSASKIVIFYSPLYVRNFEKIKLRRRWNEERLANKRTNKSSYSSSCSSSDIRSYICSDKTLSTLYCSPILIPTATLSPPINYSASLSYLIFLFWSKWWLRWLSFCYTFSSPGGRANLSVSSPFVEPTFRFHN